MGFDFWYWHIIFIKGHNDFHHLRLFHIWSFDICFGKQGRNWICIPFIIFAVQSTCIMFGLHIYDYNGIMHFTKTWQKPWMDKNIFECNYELSSWGHYRYIFHNNDPLGFIYIGYNTFVCFYCGYEMLWYTFEILFLYIQNEYRILFLKSLQLTSHLQCHNHKNMF